MKKISFLFGSGVSLKSGMPRVVDITNDLLYNNKIQYDFSRFFFEKEKASNCEITARCRDLILFIKNKIDLFYYFYDKLYANGKRETNYEDIFYALIQIHDSITFEYENPILYDLLIELEKKNLSKNVDEQLLKITTESILLIQCVVLKFLNKTISETSQFDVLIGLKEKYELKNIFTLNNDLVLETFMEKNNIIYNDGFDKETNYWHGNFDNASVISVLKLHGSINWFNTKDGINLKLNELENPINYPTIHRQIVNNCNYIPLILIGTFNKMNKYLSGVFDKLYFQFKERLEASHILIVSGYGFGDKGINIPIKHWLEKNKQNRLIVIHPNKDNLIDYARGQFEKMNESSRIAFIPKRFQDLIISDFEKLLN